MLIEVFNRVLDAIHGLLYGLRQLKQCGYTPTLDQQDRIRAIAALMQRIIEE